MSAPHQSDDRESGRLGPDVAGPEGPRGDMQALDWARRHGAVADVLEEIEKQDAAARRSRRRAVACAAMAAICALGAWRWQVSTPVAQAAVTPVATVPDQPRKQTLEDGSFFELRGDAAVRVAYSAAVRRVELVRGEAHFAVAHDAARPFVVAAGGVEFRAVGTAFAVQLGATDVDLIVTAGRVAIDRPAGGVPGSTGAGPQTLAVVGRGSHVALARDTLAPAAPRVVPLSEAELSRRLAWRAPRLEFSATPLATALEMIHRAAAAATIEPLPRLEIGDPELAAVRLSGVLRADNIETLLGVLEANHGIRAERQPDGRIVLHRAR